MGQVCFYFRLLAVTSPLFEQNIFLSNFF